MRELILHGIMWVSIGILAGLSLQRIDHWLAPKCQVEVRDPRATVIIRLEQPQPCDPASMAIEARAAVKAALEAE